MASEVEADKRVAAFEGELTVEMGLGGMSVYRVDSDNEIGLVAALYTANRDFIKPFPYFPIAEAALTGVSVVHVPEERSPFGWMNARHHEIRNATRDQIQVLASAVARSGGGDVVTRQKITALAKTERGTPTVTTSAEWERAKGWTKA